MSIKTRFCPSPTGLLTVGNLRTAFFSYLWAKAQPNNSGKFLLRIEDTDLARSKQEFVEQLKDDLNSLNLIWDEGPEYQSKRGEVYAKYYQQLLDQNLAYPCYCTEHELKLVRNNQLAAGMAPRYPGTCRNLSPEQIERKEQAGLKPALRLRITKETEIRFNDLIQGPKVFNPQDLGDFIIQKQDGTPSFMFCNAVDDSLMEVNCVLRGEDHLTNTPRQLLILELLNLTKPDYGHLPLIVGNDGKPLSKRNGSASIQELIKLGYLPIAILNYLARIGHTYVDYPNELLSLADLAKNFDLAKVGRSAAKYEPEQLKHWQKLAVLKLNNQELKEFVKLDNISDNFINLIKDNILFPKDCKFWAEKLLTNDFEYTDNAKTWCDQISKSFIQEAINGLDNCKNYQEFINHVKTNTDAKGKNLFMPIRAILSGTTDGPNLEAIFNFYSKDELVARFNRALNYK